MMLKSTTADSADEPAVILKLKRRLAGLAVAPFDVELPDGAVYRVGAGAPAFGLQLRTARAARALESLDETSICEAYIGGEMSFAGSFLAALDLRRIASDWHPLHSLWRFVRPLLFGAVRSDKDWVARHYDYGNDFYFAFLDRRHRLYSQALYRSDDEPLEQAAENKLEYVMRACRLAPGARVLDVGGGWGSFAGYAAPRGVNVTALTISREQYEFLRGRKVDVVYESIFAYESRRPYDAIVLLGVMEHLPDYQRLFERFERLLRTGGRLYMDFAANRRKFNVSSFTYRYVFPGSHTPVVVPELLAAANATRFEPIAVHNDRHSYFLTLQQWARNLEAAHDALARRYGERTYRLFQLYLWGCAHQFRRDGALESYRIAFQKAQGSPSTDIGLSIL
ncbi:MAG TPA: class I SAM-dependent methyltransferase [Burkholderiales bacterium]|nr:class I SAM-dependent methyltransferase [Burkholderiales bacterium]